MRVAFGIARLLAAVVGVVALAARLEYSLGFAGSAVANYFSYFTTQSAIAATCLWAVGGVVALRSQVDPPWLGTARMFITTYQIASGVVFYLIAVGAGASGYRLVVPVSDQFLHYWLPAYAVLDWLLAPGRRRVRFRWLPAVLVFPFVWGAFTMLRGAAVGWYPYFFLDPAQLSGFREFLAYAAGVVTFIVVMAAILTAISLFLPSPMRRLAHIEREARRAGIIPAPGTGANSPPRGKRRPRRTALPDVAPGPQR